MLSETSIIGFLAIAAIYWCLSLANRPSPDSASFYPTLPLRVMYPVGIFICFALTVLGICDVIKANGHVPWDEWFYLVVIPGFCVMLTLNWPPTITVTDEGLRRSWYLIQRLIPWIEIEDAVLSVDGRVVVYLRGQKHYEVSPYTQGRPQLVALIKSRLRQMKSAG